MNIIQAKKALDEGETLTHKSFTSLEWVKKHCFDFYIFEDGVRQEIKEFWDLRKYVDWNEGWSIYNKHDKGE